MQEVFVFGSNLAGRHGKGAALYAAENYGAELGVGEGRTGNAYALPSKDERMRTRSWDDIEVSLTKLAEAARAEPEKTFVLTPVGCGLAGLAATDMAQVIQKLEWPTNVVLHRSWLEHFTPSSVSADEQTD